jgi:hypothetical protein
VTVRVGVARGFPHPVSASHLHSHQAQTRGGTAAITIGLGAFAWGVVERDNWIVVLACQRHGDVDVLKDLARGDADHTIGRFDEVVAFASGMLAAKSVDEAESGAELFGLDQEACAVGCPIFRFHVALTRGCILARETVERDSGRRATGIRLQFSCEGEGDCTSERGVGQFSIFGAVEENGGRRFSQRDAD